MENFIREQEVEILISTMDRDSLDFLVPMFRFSIFSDFSILIVNQTQKGKFLSSDHSNIRVINSLDRGLSKSRNLAIENAVGTILLIADDDVVYEEGFIGKITKAHNEFKNAAVINFSILKTRGELMKKYPLVSKENLSSFDILNTSSIEMTLKREVLDKINIRFDESFGLGAIFEIGEEAVFLFDLKNRKQQLVFVPQIIAKHEELTSSEKQNRIEKYHLQGALFTRIFARKYFLWLMIKLFFDLKQNRLSFRDIRTVLKSAKEGSKKIRIIQNGNKQ